jgi:large subunit ribosomal protein L9
VKEQKMATPIKVVLQKDVDNLGQGGDIVRVRPGHARNYLIPRGLAVLATAPNMLRVDELKKAALANAQKSLAEAKEQQKKIEAVAVKVERAVGDEGKMYGSVTARDIEQAFEAVGITIDRKKLVLPEPLKTLGLSEVLIKLHSEVTAKLRVEVIKKT